jgi:endonuclease/exonuclease/phosphatase family metal-dependent hydrolase
LAVRQDPPTGRLPLAARAFAPLAVTLVAVSIPAATAARADTRVAISRPATPDKLSTVKGVPGPNPGETTIKWKTTGRNIDFYRITTALTPFGSRRTPPVGRHSRTFVVKGGHRRSITLSAAQTTAAGAGLPTGRRLFFRIEAVNTAGTTSTARRYPRLRHATIAGRRSTRTGHRLRFAEYNVHVGTRDLPGHPWRLRQRGIASRIARVHPAVVGVQELMPAMWTRRDGGIGLKRALRRTGVGHYRLTRRTPYFRRAAQDTRILYDTTRLRMTDRCRQGVPSCYISLPDPRHKHVAAYARFKDLASGQSFYFVSAHLSSGNDAATDALRGRQAQAVTDGIRAINRRNLPVVFATDANSSQTSHGIDAPHTALLRAGWYNTLAAARTDNVQYNTVNHYQLPEQPSPYGFGSMYDSIMTLHMPGADLFKQVLTGAPGPSDHNLVFTALRLPRA